MTKKIAIYEPYEGLRESLNLILEDYNLFHANDPVAFFNLLTLLDNVDLIIIDVDFVEDPLEFLQLVRKKYTTDQRILLLSTNFKLEFQEAVVRTGTDFSFKEKPFGKKFLEYIKVLLGEKAAKPIHVEIRISPTGELDISSDQEVDF